MISDPVAVTEFVEAMAKGAGALALVLVAVMIAVMLSK